MDLNDDRLSPSERGDLRSMITRGAKRLQERRVRRARVIGGAVAVVLVGGVTAGLSTALLAPRDPIAATPDPTTSAPVPTPSETVDEDPAPVSAFGGECVNALTDDEVTALRGAGMTLSPLRWDSGAIAVPGGLDCLWVSTDAYAAAKVSLVAYPERVVPDAIRAEYDDGDCVLDGDTVRCVRSAVVDGTWIGMRVAGADIAPDSVGELFGLATARATAHEPARAAVRTAAWTDATCADLAGRITPADLGVDELVVRPEPPVVEGNFEPPVAILAGYATACTIETVSGSGDAAQHGLIRATVVPGGAVAFDTVRTARDGQDVAVPGAAEARWVPGADRYDGAWNVLVITDGVNVITLAPDGDTDPGRLAPAASAMLAAG
ncbi:hypothetical protein [Microbacterium sp. GXF7504]